MSKNPHDINDDEIRIILPDSSNIHYERKLRDFIKHNKNSHSPDSKDRPKKNRRIITICLIVVGIIVFGVIMFFTFDPLSYDKTPVERKLDLRVVSDVRTNKSTSEYSDNGSNVVEKNAIAAKPYVAIRDTSVNGNILTIFTPVNATPSLHIGTDILYDSTPVLVVQAADVRGDNGGIVGAYVLKGELLSKGSSKAGFCAIIDDKITIGVADSTPLLESALESEGYFFRQYPLVVANQSVSNRPRGKSLRKALAELNGEIVVIMTHSPMTLGEFSQTLVDMGVSNAIYLVGSTAYGIAKDADGNKIAFGKPRRLAPQNTNYIVWN